MSGSESGRLVQVTGGWFCAGLVFEGGAVVADAAPVLAYMRGWSRARVEDYARRRGWALAEVAL